MSGIAITLIIVLGAVVVAGFLIAWTLDARRADKVTHDEERLDVDPDLAVKPVDPPPHTTWVDDAAAARPRVEPDADPGSVPEGWGDDPFGRPPADRGMR